MTRASLFAIVLMAAWPALAAQEFRGAWFTISYPDGFIAVPGLPSATADGVDSVRFREPSGRVEFYVFSPQAGGAASDIAANPATEREISTAASESGTRSVDWKTYAAKDGSYRRAVEELRTKDGLQNRVFAITYRMPADLEAFRGAYAAFKASLEQFQD